MILRVTSAAVALVLLAGCTSSGDDSDPTDTSGTTPTTSQAATTATTAATSAAPSPTATRTPLAVLDGGYLLAGADADSGRLYRVTGGRAEPATTGNAATGISSVSVDDATVVVGRDTGSAETVQQLRAGRLTGFGIDAGFAPALSDDGVLAYAVLGGSTTPGISKPGGVSIRTRSGPTGSTRTVKTYPAGGSVLGLTWSDDALVAIVSDGESVHLVTFPGGRGPAKGIAPGLFAAATDTAALVGGDDSVAVGTGDATVPARVVSLPSGEPRDIATGWQPVCFADDDVLVVAKGAQLATVAVPAAGGLGAPRVIGRAPAPVLGGACG